MGSKNMSVTKEEVASCLSDQAWLKLARLESLHQAIQSNHDKVMRSLDAAVVADDRRCLQIAWNQYRSVVADLSRVTEDIESLRLTTG
jgi:hypothetical protein